MLATEKDNIDLTDKEIRIRLHDNSFFVTLPWKEDHVTKLLEKCVEIMAELKKGSFIEKIDATNVCEEPTKIQ